MKRQVSSALISLAVLLAVVYCSFSRHAAFADEAREKSKGELALAVSTNKGKLSSGQQLVITEVFSNLGDRPLRIVDEACYRGQDVQIKDQLNNFVQGLGGKAIHTVETGMIPGISHLINPGSRYTRKLTAYLSAEHELVFENHKGAGGFSGYSAGAKDVKEIPPGFIGCGNIFPLKKAAAYRLRMRYYFDGKGAMWAVSDGTSGKDLWAGEVFSNEVSLAVEQFGSSKNSWARLKVVRQPFEYFRRTANLLHLFVKAICLLGSDIARWY